MEPLGIVIVTVLMTVIAMMILYGIWVGVSGAIDERHENTAREAARRVFSDWSFRDMRSQLNDLASSVSSLRDELNKLKAGK